MFISSALIKVNSSLCYIIYANEFLLAISTMQAEKILAYVHQTLPFSVPLPLEWEGL